MPSPQYDIPSPVVLVYDGDCPFCSAAAHMVRIKKAVGALEIVNAREAKDSEIMRAIATRGLDLNQGIVVSFEGRLYHGQDALHLLALIGSKSGWMNRLNVALFRNRTTVRLSYPFMKAIRNTTLRVLGKRPI
jgi:predicted DCC family thiol-disulfide oxidoreductase YuxK